MLFRSGRIKFWEGGGLARDDFLSLAGRLADCLSWGSENFFGAEQKNEEEKVARAAEKKNAHPRNFGMRGGPEKRRWSCNFHAGARMKRAGNIAQIGPGIAHISPKIRHFCIFAIGMLGEWQAQRGMGSRISFN